jgi:hypothetical protein
MMFLKSGFRYEIEGKRGGGGAAGILCVLALVGLTS